MFRVYFNADTHFSKWLKLNGMCECVMYVCVCVCIYLMYVVSLRTSKNELSCGKKARKQQTCKMLLVLARYSFLLFFHHHWSNEILMDFCVCTIASRKWFDVERFLFQQQTENELEDFVSIIDGRMTYFVNMKEKE